MHVVYAYLQSALLYSLFWLVGICTGFVLVHNPKAQKFWDNFVGREKGIVQALTDITDSIRHPAVVIDKWYVKRSDLTFFKERIRDSTSQHDDDWWEPLIKKEEPGEMMYAAWRRPSGHGTTEYKTVTVHANCTAEELSDFYLDDAFRMEWDNMIKYTEVLEQGDLTQQEQVVRWIRGFPFNFITDREYVMARRVFREDGVIFGITKSIDKKLLHGMAERPNSVVPVQHFYSMWSLRNVPCPWNTGETACVTTLLHHEDLRVPEHLARLTVKLSMYKFVKRMGGLGVRPFVDQRRRHCNSDATDPQAFASRPRPGARPAVLAYAVEATAEELGAGSNSSADGAAPAAGIKDNPEGSKFTGQMLGNVSPRSEDSDYMMVPRSRRRRSPLASHVKRLAVAVLGLTVAQAVRSGSQRRNRNSGRGQAASISGGRECRGFAAECGGQCHSDGADAECSEP